MNQHRRNLHQLAENLGMTVAVMLRDMPLSEYFDWMLFYSDRAAELQNDSSAKPKLPPKGSPLVMTGFGI